MSRRGPGDAAGRTARRRALCTAAAFLLFTALLLALSPGSIAETDSFTVVEHKVHEFTSKFAYISTGSKVYIPHFALTNAGIGVTTSYNPSQRYFSLKYEDKTITFDMGSSIAFDNEGHQYTGILCTLVERDGNNLIMLPVDFLCEYFEDWNYTYDYPTDYGKMLRITTKKYSTSDSNFVALFESDIRAAWAAANPSTPSSSASRPPYQSPSSAPSASPSRQPSPSPDIIPVSVYLTFEGEPNGLTTELMDLLDEFKMPAAFFMNGPAMKDYASDLRRIASTTYSLSRDGQIVYASHIIGLGGYENTAGFFSTPEETVGRINADNEILGACTLEKAMLVRLPGGSASAGDDMCSALIDAGYRYWDWTIDASPDDDGGVYDQVVSALEKAASREKIEPCVIMFRLDRLTMDDMRDILEHLANREDRFSVQPMRVSTRPINERGDLCMLAIPNDQ